MRTFRISILLLFILFYSVSSIAQNATWAWAKQSTGLGDELIPMGRAIQDNDGNYIFKGRYTDEFIYDSQAVMPMGSTVSDAFILKVNPQGELLWIKTFGLEGVFFFFINGLVTDSQNNIYFTTHLFGTGFPFDLGNGVFIEAEAQTNPAFIVKLDSDGISQWSKKFGENINSSIINTKLDIFQDTLVFAGAFSTTINFDGYTASALENGIDIFVAKLDLDANTHWLTSFGGRLTSDQVVNIVANEIGEIYASLEWEGDTLFAQDQFVVNDMPTFLPFGGNTDRVLIKYNASGQVEWMQKEASEEPEFGGMLFSASDGGVFISSVTDSGITIGDAEIPAGALIISKYSASGSVEDVISISGTEYTSSPVVFSDSENNVYFAFEFTSGQVNFQNANIVNSGGNIGTTDIALVKLDNLGSLQWAFSIGGTETESIGDLIVQDDGSVFILGSYSSQMLELGSFTLNNGQELTNNFFLAEFDVPTTLSELSANLSAKLYPNPCNNQICIDLSSFAGKEVNVRLTSLEGKIISEDRLIVNSPTLIKATNNLSSGIYFLEIRSDTDYNVQKFSVLR